MIILKAGKSEPDLNCPCGEAWHNLCIETISIPYLKSKVNESK